MSNTFRDEMQLDSEFAYFDHAAVSPLTAQACKEMESQLQQVTSSGCWHWLSWRERVEQCRSLAAKLINAQESEIALSHSTTEGLGFVAEGYPWQSGENVVLPTGEFPSNRFPWMNLKRKGVEVREVEMPSGELDLDRIADACDEKTRVISCSWVGYLSGYRVNLAELCDVAQKANARLCLDAIQGLGVMQLDVKQTPIDYMSADGHKWLLGPEGAGIFYVREDRLAELQPLGVGWNSVKASGDFSHGGFELKQETSRYEGGTFNMIGLAGLTGSLRVFNQWGVDSVHHSLKQVVSQVQQFLDSVGAERFSPEIDSDHWSGILTFTIPGISSLKLRDFCYQRKVICSHRGGYLRLSPHAYTDDTDLDRLKAVLTEGIETLRAEA